MLSLQPVWHQRVPPELQTLCLRRWAAAAAYHQCEPCPAKFLYWVSFVVTVHLFPATGQLREQRPFHRQSWAAGILHRGTATRLVTSCTWKFLTNPVIRVIAAGLSSCFISSVDILLLQMSAYAQDAMHCSAPSGCPELEDPHASPACGPPLPPILAHPT